MTEDLMANLAASLASARPVHWVGDVPTSLHGNGAASFARTTRDSAEVTCRLCLTLLAREAQNRPQVCRECSQIGGSKHGACNGTALVDDGMNILDVDCLCASGGHS